MQHIFVYGSLLFPELVRKLTGKRFNSVPATVKGFKRFAVKGCDYPAIVPCNDCAVQGLLLLDVDEESVHVLTLYEGEEYSKKEVDVFAGELKYKAIAFVWESDLCYLEDFDWDQNAFRQQSLQNYVANIAPNTERESGNSDV
ncbi:gamma-glutamylcyclotransferase family protein [Maribellus comscasis]|nr:gamma-glutamylcyclotransferase family protein [Maribellus comscasis]